MSKAGSQARERGGFAGMMAIGVVVGAVLQRGRFRFASAFRDAAKRRGRARAEREWA